MTHSVCVNTVIKSSADVWSKLNDVTGVCQIEYMILSFTLCSIEKDCYELINHIDQVFILSLIFQFDPTFDCKRFLNHHTCSHILSLSHTHSQTNTHTHLLSLTHTHSLPHTHTHSHTHSQTASQRLIYYLLLSRM